MEIQVTSEFKKKTRRLHKTNPKLYQKAKQAVSLFSANPRHPSLRLHKLNDSKRWSLSVNRSLRITYKYVDDHILLVDIGTHDEVYR